MNCLFLAAGATVWIGEVSNLGPPVVAARLNDIQLLTIHRRVVRSKDLPRLGVNREIERLTEAVSEDPWISVWAIEKRISRCSCAVFFIDAEEFAYWRAQTLRGVIGHIELHVIIADGDIEEAVSSEMDLAVGVEAGMLRKRHREVAHDNILFLAFAVAVCEAEDNRAGRLPRHRRW